MASRAMNVGIAAQQNVGAAAGHIGRDGDRALASGLRHDMGFALMVFGVQNLMPHAHLLQQSREPLGFFDGNGADQNRLAAFPGTP